MGKRNSEISFTKMQGAGNDYVYVDAVHTPPLSSDYLSRLAIEISDRHFGVGGDGLVVVLPSEVADFRMRMWNADGSEAQMCGNASRCVGKLVYESGLTQKRVITLETLAGIKVLHLNVGPGGEVESVRVDMGEPVLDAAVVPVAAGAYSQAGKAALVRMDFEGERFEAVAVSMGNPHGVIFLEESPSDRHVLTIGPAFERHEAWPEKVNVEFVRVIDRHAVEMRVWERGSGETLACGTGACATAVAGIITGRLDSPVEVRLLGGTLLIEWSPADRHVYMTGPATTVARGVYYPASEAADESTNDESTNKSGA